MSNFCPEVIAVTEREERMMRPMAEQTTAKEAREPSGVRIESNSILIHPVDR